MSWLPGYLCGKCVFCCDLQGRGGSSPTPEEASAASSQQKSSGKIPIIGLLEGSSSVQPQIAATADGAAIRLNELQSVAVALGAQSGSSPAEQVPPG